MRGADREEPVLDRLRGVMRVGCSGARSEESSRWAATLAAAALRAWACCWRCSGEAYESTGPERVGGPSTWLWPVHSPSPSHWNTTPRRDAYVAISIFKQESSSQFLPRPVLPERRRPRFKLYTGETTIYNQCAFCNEASRPGGLPGHLPASIL